MKNIAIAVSCVLLSTYSIAGTKQECLGGNFPVCRDIFNQYGSTTDQRGATDLFASACSSQNLKLKCEIISVDRSETLKKTLEVADLDGALFVINGKKVDKIYKVSTVK